jgi:hypothetical protein
MKIHQTQLDPRPSALYLFFINGKGPRYKHRVNTFITEKKLGPFHDPLIYKG